MIIYDTSNESYIINNEYYIKSSFLLDNNLISEYEKFYNNYKNNPSGALYGEIEPDSFDISLNNVSHIISDIGNNPIMLSRKLKLQKLKGIEITKIAFDIEIRLLKTSSGKIVNDLLLNNIKLKTALRCRDNKIITIDIYLLPSV
jgi:hypothetical protein